MRKHVLIGLAAVLAAGATPGIAGAAVAETYTLDGTSVGKAQALNPSTMCPATEQPDGVYECFSSDAKRQNATEASRAAGRLIPGATGAEGEVAKGAPRPESAGARASREPKARRLACGREATHVYTSTSYGGNHGWFTYEAGWHNHSNTFRNTISSYKNSEVRATAWARGLNGGGDWYNYSYTCRDLGSLTSTWDNDFESWIFA